MYSNFAESFSNSLPLPPLLQHPANNLQTHITDPAGFHQLVSTSWGVDTVIVTSLKREQGPTSTDPQKPAPEQRVAGLRMTVFTEARRDIPLSLLSIKHSLPHR